MKVYRGSEPHAEVVDFEPGDLITIVWPTSRAQAIVSERVVNEDGTVTFRLINDPCADDG